MPDRVRKPLPFFVSLSVVAPAKRNNAWGMVMSKALLSMSQASVFHVGGRGGQEVAAGRPRLERTAVEIRR